MANAGDGNIEGVSWEVYPLSTPVMAKYFRYIGMGSNISTWNAIKEIRFRLSSYDALTQNASYSIKDNGNLTVTARGFAAGNGIIAAFYDSSGALIDCKLKAYEDGANTVDTKSGLFESSDAFKLMIWDMESLEGYFVREHNTADILK